MRELTIEETSQVSGGGLIGEMAADAGAVGTAAGYVAKRTLAGATRGGVAGAMIGTSFAIGYVAGSYAYDRFIDS